jgi:hypothetical protein
MRGIVKHVQGGVIIRQQQKRAGEGQHVLTPSHINQPSWLPMNLSRSILDSYQFPSLSQTLAKRMWPSSRKKSLDEAWKDIALARICREIEYVKGSCMALSVTENNQS